MTNFIDDEYASGRGGTLPSLRVFRIIAAIPLKKGMPRRGEVSESQTLCDGEGEGAPVEGSPTARQRVWPEGLSATTGRVRLTDQCEGEYRDMPENNPNGTASTDEDAATPRENGDSNTARTPVSSPDAGENAGKRRTITRRDVLAMAGCGVAGLVVGGVLASWGVTSRSIASGRIDIRTTPTKMIVTDRARCSGCQRCEMMCTLRNDGRVCQSIARVRVWPNYNYGHGVDTEDGIYENCQFTVEHCKQCEDPWCMNSCPVHAIYADEESGARLVDADRCIGCGMCHMACPWNMPVVDSETNVSTKCISCGRCAEQCPNGAIRFVDWEDIAQKVIDQGVVRTTTLVQS